MHQQNESRVVDSRPSTDVDEKSEAHAEQAPGSGDVHEVNAERLTEKSADDQEHQWLSGLKLYLVTIAIGLGAFLIFLDATIIVTVSNEAAPNPPVTTSGGAKLSFCAGIASHYKRIPLAT